MRTPLTDWRGATDGTLADALVSGDPLAVAELLRRTLPAGHAVARRLLGTVRDVEALLVDTYVAVMASPPGDSLEGAVRREVAQRGAAELARRNQAPAAPSLTDLLVDLPHPEGESTDPAELALARLDAVARLALLRAHDLGEVQIVTDPRSAHAVATALVELAGGDPEEAEGAGRLVGAVLGLTDRGTLDEATRYPGGHELVALLRRGRRRLEGLPPTADLGQRLAAVLVAGHGTDEGARAELAQADREPPTEAAGASPVPPVAGPVPPAADPVPPAAPPKGVDPPGGNLGDARPPDRDRRDQEALDADAADPDRPGDHLGPSRVRQLVLAILVVVLGVALGVGAGLIYLRLS